MTVCWYTGLAAGCHGRRSVQHIIIRKERVEMDYNKLADLLFGQVDKTPDYWENQFPERNLPEGAQVTRMAPSPTGFIHLGNLYSSLADERIAHQSKGVFFLRIEDTDAKRKVEGAVETIIEVLKYFGITFDEGAGIDDPEQNAYGPYFQRQRVEIYHTYVKDLVQRGLAYPCFCTEEELAEIKEQQTEEKALTGYHTKWAKCRDLSYEEIEANIKAGKPYVMRLKSMGSEDKEIIFQDTVKGRIRFPENIQDIVILKSDGIPTYHFAHAIDDHLMRTTTVVRGEEWLSSVPVHYELFHALGFKMPKYVHTAHLMKIDEETGSKRKLSKRKDPELSLDFYRKDGYHPQCVKVYLMTLLNSNFEQWYDKHPNSPIEEFPYSIKKMAQSGALFDIAKLHDICKNEFAKLDPQEVFDFLKTWCSTYQPDMMNVYFADDEKFMKVINLCMGIGGKRRRKDFCYAAQIFESLAMYFDETLVPSYEFSYDKELVKEILNDYLASYDHAWNASEWFGAIKAMGEKYGFTGDMKAYKANPGNYKGNVSHVAEILRIAITGSSNSPDLWTINQILGEEVMKKRIENVIAHL